MDAQQLSSELLAAGLEDGEVVYLERRGAEYDWARGQVQPTADLPDGWFFYMGAWPGEAARWPAFFTDLLAELDTLVDGGDRCRWDPGDPWPHGGLRGHA